MGYDQTYGLRTSALATVFLYNIHTMQVDALHMNSFTQDGWLLLWVYCGPQHRIKCLHYPQAECWNIIILDGDLMLTVSFKGLGGFTCLWRAPRNLFSLCINWFLSQIPEFPCFFLCIFCLVWISLIHLQFLFCSTSRNTTGNCLFYVQNAVRLFCLSSRKWMWWLAHFPASSSPRVVFDRNPLEGASCPVSPPLPALSARAGSTKYILRKLIHI